MLGQSSRTMMLIGIGFLLMAGGVPISSPAMFGFLASTVHDNGWSWLFAGLFVSFFTVAGHAMCYAAFRKFGPSVWSKIVRRYPGMLGAISPDSSILAALFLMPSCMAPIVSSPIELPAILFIPVHPHQSVV
jgi:hypothetical protein